MKAFSVFLFLTICSELSWSFTFRPSIINVDLKNRTAREEALSQIFFFNPFKSKTTTTTTTRTTFAPITATTEEAIPKALPLVNNSISHLENNASSTSNATTTPTICVSRRTIDQLEPLKSGFPTDVYLKNFGGQGLACPHQLHKMHTKQTQAKSIVLSFSCTLLSSSIKISQLCSNVNVSVSTTEYRFDPDAKVCSMVGSQSHCGKSMIFYSFAGNQIYGHCDCDYSSKIPLLYHELSKRCYFIYQQAFCKQEEWLELRKENGTISAVCTVNKCYNAGRVGFGVPPLASRDIAPEYVPFQGNGSCVRLGQPNERLCKNRNETISFNWPKELYPKCKEAILSDSGLIAVLPRYLGQVASLECTPGSYLDAVGNCQPDWEF